MSQLPEPDRATEDRDQHAFDEAVDRDLKVILAWAAGAGILAALVMSTVALVRGTGRTVTVTQQAAAPPVAATAAAPAPGTRPKTLDVKIAGGSKPGPDGKKHDAYTVTEFPVKVGQSLTLRIDNTDDVSHNIVAPDVNVSILVKPGVHSYVLRVDTPGRFVWFCSIPCDTDASGWAMQHEGFMTGYIVAT